MARQYKRDGDGKFAAGGATTIKQNKAGKTAEKRKAKKELSGNRLGGKNKRKRQSVKLKTRGSKVTTRQAKNAAARSRKRFG